jgi:hypothetical protein
LEGYEYFASGNLLLPKGKLAWAPLGLSLLATLIAARRRYRDREGPSAWFEAPSVLINCPIYLWGVTACVQLIMLFDLITMHVDRQIFWAIPISLFVQLGYVLLLSTFSLSLLGPTRARDTSFNAVGPLLAVATVSLIIIFFLTAITPFEP